MRKQLKLKYIVGGIVLIVLFATNPSMQSFRDFAGQKNTSNVELKKNYNLLLFSIFSDNSELKYDKDYSSRFEEYSKYKSHKYYLGILMNFVEITATKEKANEY